MGLVTNANKHADITLRERLFPLMTIMRISKRNFRE